MKRENKYSIDCLIDMLEKLEELTKDYNILAKDLGEEPLQRTGIPKYLYDTEHCIKEKEQLISFAEKSQIENLKRINSQLPLIYMFAKERIDMLTDARNELLEKYNARELAKIA